MTRIVFVAPRLSGVIPTLSGVAPALSGVAPKMNGVTPALTFWGPGPERSKRSKEPLGEFDSRPTHSARGAHGARREATVDSSPRASET